MTRGEETAENAVHRLAFEIAQKATLVPGPTGHPYNVSAEHGTWALWGAYRAGGAGVGEAREALAEEIARSVLGWGKRDFTDFAPLREDDDVVAVGQGAEQLREALRDFEREVGGIAGSLHYDGLDPARAADELAAACENARAAFKRTEVR